MFSKDPSHKIWEKALLWPSTDELKLSNLLVSQRVPVKPPVQRHWYSVVPLIPPVKQVPEFRQGEGSHASFSQWFPLYPMGQLQVYPVLLGVQTPLFRHGLESQELQVIPVRPAGQEQ